MEAKNQTNEKIPDSKNEKWYSSKTDLILTTIFTIGFIIQIILLFLYNNELNLTSVRYIGHVLWVITIFFGIAPIIILRRKGKAPKGKSYMNTTTIVTSGLYSLVRHPQYLAGIFFTLSITCLTQSWISLVLTVFLIILTYDWTFREDKILIEKFGDEYRQYKNNVPRLNILLGIIYYVIKKDRNKIEAI